MATFADLVKAMDAATLPVLAALDASGPQYLIASDTQVWVFIRDSSPTGFRVMVAAKGSETQAAPSKATPAAMIAAAKTELANAAAAVS